MDNDDDDILLWLLLDSADDPIDDKTNVESGVEKGVESGVETDSPDNQTKGIGDSLSKVSVTRASDNKLYNYELSTNNGLPPKESFKGGYTQFFKRVSLQGFKPSNLEGEEKEYTVSSGDNTSKFKIKEIDKQVATDSLAIKIDPSNENTVYFSQNKMTFTHEK